MIKVMSFNGTIVSDNAAEVSKNDIDRMICSGVWHLLGITTTLEDNTVMHHYHFHRITPTK